MKTAPMMVLSLSINYLQRHENYQPTTTKSTATKLGRYVPGPCGCICILVYGFSGDGVRRNEENKDLLIIATDHTSLLMCEKKKER